MTQRKSIGSYRRPEVSTTLCYDWIEVSQIESVIEEVPYLRIIYKDGTSFLIDWSIENRDRFNIFIYGRNSL